MNERRCLEVVLMLTVVLPGALSARAAGEPAKAPAEPHPQLGSPAYNDRWAANDLRTVAAAQVAFRMAANRYAAASFVFLVEPVDRDTSGNRWLYADESGVIRFSTTPEIGPDSPPL